MNNKPVNLYPLTEKQYKIAEYLKRVNRECTAKEISFGVMGRFGRADYANHVLPVLVKYGLIEKIERPCQPDRYQWKT